MLRMSPSSSQIVNQLAFLSNFAHSFSFRHALGSVRLVWRIIMRTCSAAFGLFIPAFYFALSVSSAAQSAPASKAAPAKTADSASGYDQPPQNILDVMRAGSPPQPLVSPTHDTILLV